MTIGTAAHQFLEEATKGAYVHNALFHLNLLRSTIYDGLTGANDVELRKSLCIDLDEAEHNLLKALLAP